MGIGTASLPSSLFVSIVGIVAASLPSSLFVSIVGIVAASKLSLLLSFLIASDISSILEATPLPETTASLYSSFLKNSCAASSKLPSFNNFNVLGLPERSPLKKPSTTNFCRFSLYSLKLGNFLSISSSLLCISFSNSCSASSSVIFIPFFTSAP